MENFNNSQKNSKGQLIEENPLKHVDEFKNICHNMFKNFLDQNLCTIVDDVYKKFSAKINPETGNLHKKELKEDFQQMVNSVIDQTINSKTEEIVNQQQFSHQNLDSINQVNDVLLLKKKKHRKNIEEQNESSQEKSVPIHEDSKKKKTMKMKNYEKNINSPNSKFKSPNSSFLVDENISASDSDNVAKLKNNLLNDGKNLTRSKFKNSSKTKMEGKQRIDLEPILDNINYEQNLNYKKIKNDEERINVFDNLNSNEEDFFIKYLKDKIKNDQPFRILFEVCQKCKFNTPEVIINAIGKNDQFSVKIFVNNFYFYGDGLAQSKKEGKKLAAYDMLDKLLIFKDSRTSTISALCIIFKIDKFKLIQQNKEALKANKFDQSISKSNLENIDLNKDIQDLEKIFENIKYEYKLSSHIARFHKYIDDKKTYIVKIKINDKLFLEESGNRDESTYRRALRETIKRLRNKYVLGISDNDQEIKVEENDYSISQTNKISQNDAPNYFKETENNNSDAINPNVFSNLNNINNFDNYPNVNHPHNIIINEKKIIPENKRRRLEINSNDHFFKSINNNEIAFGNNYTQNFDGMNQFNNNNLYPNNYIPGNFNNFNNYDDINYINNEIPNNFNNYNFDNNNNYNNNFIPNQFPIGMNNLMPLNNNPYNFIIEQNQMQNNFDYPMNMDMNPMSFTENMQIPIDSMDNSNPIQNNILNISTNNPIQNLPNFQKLPLTNNLNNNNNLIDSNLNSNLDTNNIMDSFLNNYNSNNLINNLNKIKKTQKDKKNNDNSNKISDINKLNENIPLVNPIDTIGTQNHSNINLNSNNNLSIEQTIKDRSKFCEKYELSSERSEKFQNKKDLKDLEMNDTSKKTSGEIITIENMNDYSINKNKKFEENSQKEKTDLEKSNKKSIIITPGKEDQFLESLNEEEIEMIIEDIKNEDNQKGSSGAKLEKKKKRETEDSFINLNRESSFKKTSNLKNKLSDYKNKEISSLIDKDHEKSKLEIYDNLDNNYSIKKDSNSILDYSNNKIIENINNTRKKMVNFDYDCQQNNTSENFIKNINNDKEIQNKDDLNQSKDINLNLSNKNSSNKNIKEMEKKNNRDNNKNKNKHEKFQNISHTNIPSNPLKAKKKKHDPEMEKINRNWKSNLGAIEKQKEKEFFERFDSKEDSDNEDSSQELNEDQDNSKSNESKELIDYITEDIEKEVKKPLLENENKKSQYEFMKSPTLSSKSNKKRVSENKEIEDNSNNLSLSERPQEYLNFIKKSGIDDKIDKKLEMLQVEKKEVKNTNFGNNYSLKSNKIDELLEAKNNVKQLIRKDKNLLIKQESKNENSNNNILVNNLNDKMIPIPNPFNFSKDIDAVEKVIEKIKEQKGDHRQRNFEIFCLRLERTFETKTFLFYNYINEYINLLINLCNRLKIGYSFIGSFYLNILRRDELNIDAILGDSNNDTKKIDIMFFIKNEFKNFFTNLYPSKQSNVAVSNENHKTKIKISIIDNPLTLTLYFINSGIEFYEDLSDYKKFLSENEDVYSSSDFFILASLLRLWRKNFNLYFLPAEFLDFLIVNYKSELISDTIARIFVFLMKQSVFSIAEKYYENKKFIGNKWALNITRNISNYENKRIMEVCERCLDFIKNEKFKDIFIQ